MSNHCLGLLATAHELGRTRVLTRVGKNNFYVIYSTRFAWEWTLAVKILLSANR